MRSLLLVVVGGALGTLSRFGVNEAVSHDGLFPVATFAVNVVGSFALGMLLAAILTPWLGLTASAARDGFSRRLHDLQRSGGRDRCADPR